MRTIIWLAGTSKSWIFLIVIFVLGFITYWHHQLGNLHSSHQPSLTDPLPIQLFTSKSQYAYPNLLQSQIIFYNRIPKTGSTSFMGIAYELCGPNEFSVIHLNTTKNSHTLSPSDQLRFAHNITNWTQRHPLLIHGHLGYLDFGSLGSPTRPIYINLVRDPLERLVSYYYFLRYGDNFRPQVQRRRKGNNESFDECVQRHGADCDPSNLWMQIPFFCGHHASCWEPGNVWALAQAKHNLAQEYFLVGTTDEMEDFLRILEVSLPKFFTGAHKLFQEGGKSHLRKTFGKKPLKEQTISTFTSSKIWEMEMDFYKFAQQQFIFVKKKMFPESSISNTNNVNNDSPYSSQQFRYEKIRPNFKSTSN